jgi:hypothetical protein
MLVETKGAIPNTFMHSFKDNIRLTSENDQLRKIIKDCKQLIVDEREFNAKLANKKEEKNKKLKNEIEEMKNKFYWVEQQ